MCTESTRKKQSKKQKLKYSGRVLITITTSPSHANGLSLRLTQASLRFCTRELGRAAGKRPRPGSESNMIRRQIKRKKKTRESGRAAGKCPRPRSGLELRYQEKYRIGSGTLKKQKLALLRAMHFPCTTWTEHHVVYRRCAKDILLTRNHVRSNITLGLEKRSRRLCSDLKPTSKPLI